MEIVADGQSLWDRALDGGGFVGIAILLLVLCSIAFSKYVVMPALKILREMTENCTRAAADNRAAASDHRAASADIKGTARILEKLIQKNGEASNEQ